MKRRIAPVSQLYAPEPQERLAAVAGVDSEPASRYALRDVMRGDRDGRVRARAAARLGTRGLPMIDALTEVAVFDHLPSVREAAWRSLSRASAEDLGEPVTRAARHRLESEPVWWVRMAIAATLAKAPGPHRVNALRDVLLDPFWRVRHTGVKALLALGRESSQAREQILTPTVRSDVEGAALLFLQRAWHDERGEVLEPNALAAPPPTDPLWDADPAVISARLEDSTSNPSLALLVELLADAHASTRELAFDHLARRSDLREVRVALEWLDEPRIPYASHMAARLAAHLGDRAEELVSDLLSSPTATGPLCWAIAWIGETKSESYCRQVAAMLDHRDPRVREAAIECLARIGHAGKHADRLLPIATSGEDAERFAATRALISTSRQRAETLLELIEPATAEPRLRRLLTRELATPMARVAWLERAADDDDFETRALALGALDSLGELSDSARASALSSSDPVIRRAVLDDESAILLATSDPDPQVRRAALRRCGGADSGENNGGENNGRDARLAAADASDRRLRVEAARLLDPGDASELAALLELSRQRSPMVRAAAASRLESYASELLDPRVTELADNSNGSVFIAATTWLCRRFDESAAAWLERSWKREDLSAESRHHLQALRLTLPDSLACNVPAATRRPPRAPKQLPALAPGSITTRRRLGRSELEISPLVISGVKDLSMGSLRHAYNAGVNTYFWEPRYHHLGGFLKRPELRETVNVVAGSYHGTPEAIEKDVDTALRRLKREQIDLFLIFWVRSAERLSANVWECLQRLKQSGKIGACGFSSHHRDIAANAIVANPWDAIMIRHSAAHTGAEERLLAVADENDVGVLAFTSLCYGRLLQPSPARDKTAAPDCYRYSLSQAGVTAVVSAPARHREVVENVCVLEETELDPRHVASMREHGAWVYERSKDFGALIRRTPRELPRAAAARLIEKDNR